MTSSALYLAVVAVAIVGLHAQGFGVGVTNTKCNVDPSRGTVNDPCPSMYNAECGGTYCKCPMGTVEDTTGLGKCVRRNDSLFPQQHGPHDTFSDLPHEYDPNNPNSRPQRPVPGAIDVNNTPCTATNDPCLTLHNAVCKMGYCKCQTGTMQHPNEARCIADDGTRRHQNTDPWNRHPDSSRPSGAASLAAGVAAVVATSIALMV